MFLEKNNKIMFLILRIIFKVQIYSIQMFKIFKIIILFLNNNKLKKTHKIQNLNILVNKLINPIIIKNLLKYKQTIFQI